MAVIDIGMDIPKDCVSCEHRVECVAFGKEWTYEPNKRYSLGIHCRLDDCPLKSIDGLIEKIGQDDEIFMYDKSKYTAETVIPLWRLRQIIKEYCGGENE